MSDQRSDGRTGLLAYTALGIALIAVGGLFWSVGTAVPPVYWASRQEISDIASARVMVYVWSTVLAIAPALLAIDRRFLATALVAPAVFLPALTIALTPTPSSLINGSYRPLVVWAVAAVCLLAAIAGAMVGAIRR